MKNIKKIFSGLVASALLAVTMSVSAFGVSLTISPMNERIILNPGETYTGSFAVSNPASEAGKLVYGVTAEPFYVDENYDIHYEKEGDYNQIVEWTTINNPEGEIEPNEVVEIGFTIDVPENAPAGGQYLSLTTKVKNVENATSGINITSIPAVAHIVYAEIAGTTERSGEIMSANVPSFVFSGKLAGSSAVKNTGNVHGTAKYTMQVYPIFSDEEVFTNEEDPEEKTVLPDRTLYNETVWEETPFFGIYNVVYTVEFEGVTNQVSKMVIVCPIWLLFIVIFAIIMIIAWLVARARARK